MAALEESSQSNRPALYVLERLARGDGYYHDALRRSEALSTSFQAWQDKASLILAESARAVEKKLERKAATEKKLKRLRSEVTNFTARVF